MSRPPRYAPKSRYRTRQSGGEVEGLGDNSATAIDRVVPDLDELERKYGRRGEDPPAPETKRNLVPLLVAALAAALLAIGVLGTFVLILLLR